MPEAPTRQDLRDAAEPLRDLIGRTRLAGGHQHHLIDGPYRSLLAGIEAVELAGPDDPSGWSHEETRLRAERAALPSLKSTTRKDHQ